MTEESPSRPYSRRTALLCVAAAALVLRLGFLWAQGAPELKGDAAHYSSYAETLISEGRYAEPDGSRAARMPGYPLLMAGVYAVFGRSTAALLVVQCLMGAGTCVFIFLIADGLLKPPWPLLCGAAAVLSWDLIHADISPLAESPYAFLTAAAFAALLHKDWPPLRRALTGGGAFALAYLTRPEILPLAGLTLLALPSLFDGLGRRERLAALAALGVVVCAWTARNALVLGRFVPGSTMGEHVFYLALRHPVEHLGMADDERFLAPPETPEMERGAAYRRAYSELRGRLTAGQTIKCYVFNALSVFYPFLPRYDATYAVLVPFWLVGLWAALRLKPWWPLAALAPMMTLVYIFFGGPASRYRYPFAAALIPLAALGAKHLLEKAGPVRLRWGAGVWGGLNAAVWIWGPQFRAAALALRDAIWK